MSIWTDKNGSSSTSWTADDDSVTQAWTDDSFGLETIGISPATGITSGTYDSAAAAATSLIGSKYHLFDNSEFFFGTDQDVRLSFETDGSGMLIRVFPAQGESATLMTLRNGDTDMVKYKGDKSMQLLEASSLPGTPVEGSFIYHDNEFYLAK